MVLLRGVLQRGGQGGRAALSGHHGSLEGAGAEGANGKVAGAVSGPPWREPQRWGLFTFFDLLL